MIREGEQLKAFSFYAVGVEGAHFDVLRQIAVKEPLKLKGLQFRELFAWLSSSLSSVSKSTVGTRCRFKIRQHPTVGQLLDKRCPGGAGLEPVRPAHHTFELGPPNRIELAASSLLRDEHALLAIVSDGAGSADYSAIGSRLVVGMLCTCVDRSLTRQISSVEIITKELALDWLDNVRDHIFRPAEHGGLVRLSYGSHVSWRNHIFELRNRLSHWRRSMRVTQKRRE
jgi:hypothetical protein